MSLSNVLEGAPTIKAFEFANSTFHQENKWRAVRYGLDGQMIDFGKEQEVPIRDLIRELPRVRRRCY